MSEELQYLLVVVGLFIAPRVLQRHRIPNAITCVVIGAILGMGFGLFHGDAVIPLLATLGIVSLFLFAGLEVDFDELREGLSVTLGHLGVLVVMLVGGAWAFSAIFALQWRPAVLLALAVFTPSTGFILDSLASFGLTDQQRFWVKTKAIASELVALVALFAVVQSSSMSSLAVASAALAAMVALLPWVFQVFASRVLPHAPKSEFAFLLILALMCAYLTRHLGVYYLVGAFVVGVTAVRLRKRIPELASERMVAGIDLFASFFIPFYFFKAGLHLRSELFQWQALLIGAALVIVTVPLRVGVVAGYRTVILREPIHESVRISLSLVPTLVFTLVLAGILRERFGLADHLFGALVVFALVNTAVPGLLLRPRRAAADAQPAAGTQPAVAGAAAGAQPVIAGAAAGAQPAAPVTRARTVSGAQPAVSDARPRTVSGAQPVVSDARPRTVSGAQPVVSAAAPPGPSGAAASAAAAPAVGPPAPAGTAAPPAPSVASPPPPREPSEPSPTAGEAARAEQPPRLPETS